MANALRDTPAGDASSARQNSYQRPISRENPPTSDHGVEADTCGPGAEPAALGPATALGTVGECLVRNVMNGCWAARLAR
jgi:hypothetical protein